jgi:N-acetylmuramoyl-L-alanine amidase
VPPQHDEVDQCTKIVTTVADKMRAAGVEVVTFLDTVSTSQSANLDRIVDWHNAQGKRDYDVSCHLNAFDHSAHGVEVLYVTQSSLASKVSAAIAEAGHLTNRGAKKRTDLAFLNGTSAPAILLECHFCDNTSDCNLHEQHYDAICEAIAEAITGEEVPDEEQPPIDELPPIEPEENRVDITVAATGNVTVIANGNSHIIGDPACTDKVTMTLAAEGNVYVTVNEQDFHGMAPGSPQEPTGAIPANQRDITATVFGGAADGEYSAYPPYDSSGRGPYLNDTDLYVSLPVNVPDEATRKRGVRVFNANSELSAVGAVMDKGPWVVNDEDYVWGDARPIAETCYRNGTPLPSGSGPNAGKVPSNDAGIDLSPALADAIGIEGKGRVHWQFVDEVVG